MFSYTVVITSGWKFTETLGGRQDLCSACILDEENEAQRDKGNLPKILSPEVADGAGPVCQLCPELISTMLSYQY